MSFSKILESIGSKDIGLKLVEVVLFPDLCMGTIFASLLQSGKIPDCIDPLNSLQIILQIWSFKNLYINIGTSLMSDFLLNNEEIILWTS